MKNLCRWRMCKSNSHFLPSDQCFCVASFRFSVPMSSIGGKFPKISTSPPEISMFSGDFRKFPLDVADIEISQPRTCPMWSLASALPISPVHPCHPPAFPPCCFPPSYCGNNIFLTNKFCFLNIASHLPEVRCLQLCYKLH